VARYVPPAADSTAPLDEVQSAIVDEIAAIMIRKYREELDEARKAEDLDRTTRPRKRAAAGG
jgi:hypothetical protein